ncbi:MAG TPA: response regulator [Kiritimatiellia bacterium]|nr:response regulator [Kiritimatiellia bacterium]
MSSSVFTSSAIATHTGTENDDRPKRNHILLVDDDITIRTLAKRALEQAGYEVLTLDHGAGVVDLVCQNPPDAIFLDVMLPDTDGFSICRALRALPEVAYTPIIMLTSLNDEEAIRSAFEAGATEFVTKPANWLHEGYRLKYLLRASDNMRDLELARVRILQAEQQWEKTFEAIDDPLLILGPDLAIRQANQAAQRFLKNSGLLNPSPSCNNAICCGLDDAGKCPARKAIELHTPTQAELRNFGRGRRDCLVSVAPIMTRDTGVIHSLIYSIKDITEYRELQKELLQAQKMEALGVLAAGIAHDFNNLLQGIVGWADILSHQEPSTEDLHKGLAQVADIAARGRALTQQLLFTARKAEGKKAPVQLGKLVQEVANLLSRTQPKTINIETEIAPALNYVTADPSHLHQALMNLAVNAVQAMNGQGSLRIEASNVTLDDAYSLSHPDSKTGPHVLIAISDTGSGIAPHDLDRIYDPFFTTKPIGQGTGLGLSIVFGIIRDHGGHVRCYSELGKGTTFRIYLPAQPHREPVPGTESAIATPPPPSGEGKTILIAEDDPLIHTLLVRILEHQKYTVIPTFNGEEALHAYLQQPSTIDCIILDMNMPVMDGEKCLIQLRETGAEIPIILATGALFSSEREAQILNYATQIVMKPFQSRDLIQTIERVIATPTSLPTP